MDLKNSVLDVALSQNAQKINVLSEIFEITLIVPIVVCVMIYV